MKRFILNITNAFIITMAILYSGIPVYQVSAAQKPSKEFIKTRSKIDKAFTDSLASGLSLVIVPTINLDYKYKGMGTQKILIEAEKEFTSDRTFTLNWSRDNSNNIELRTGNIRYIFGSIGRDVENDGTLPSLFQIAEGSITYQVYVVVPGTYNLTGHSSEIHETTAPPAEWDKTYQGNMIGMLSLKEEKSPKYYRAVEWKDESLGTRGRRETYCTSVYVVTGGCAYWQKRSWQEDYVTRPAGYYDSLKSELVDSVIAEHKLSRPFASFSVASGEAILIDGMFAEFPNSNFQAQDCSRTKPDSVSCPLTGYTLAKLSGVEEGFRKIDYSGQLLPKFEKIAAKAVYRPLTIYASVGGPSSRWGPSYTMTPDKK